ncbi:hypothetical protein K2P96_03075, partial [Patescibacteria group bacterium]|nr:hypothetical protein [Patescibacteria group bacterium]
KLASQKEKLSSMLADIKQSFSLAITVQDQIRQATDIVNKTNFMFNDPNGANPKLITKNPLSNIPIEAQRAGVNTILSGWQGKLSLSSLHLLDVAASEKIKQNAQDIQTYLNNLSTIVDHLTPENSGLTQFQIDTYAAKLPPKDAIQQVINNIQDAIDHANGGGNGNGGTGGTGDNGNGTTPEDVIQQQNTVDETQHEIDEIQHQIDQINQQQNQNNNPPVQQADNSTPTVDTSGTPPPTDNNTINYGVKRVIDKHQGILIQPGEPQLIQGSDPY